MSELIRDMIILKNLKIYIDPSDSPVPGILQARTLEWVAWEERNFLSR